VPKIKTKLINVHFIFFFFHGHSLLKT